MGRDPLTIASRLGVLLAALPALAAPAAETAVLRARVPALIEPARCAGIAPEQIVVEEDGVERPVLALDRVGPARLHALLLDDGDARRRHTAPLAAALADYLARIPQGEPALLLTFGEEVILRAPPTTDRGALLAALGPAAHGGRTAVLDALDSVLRLLSPRSERKIVVLFTDGYDDASRGVYSAESLADLARSAGPATIFTVRAGGKAGVAPSAIELLDRVSLATGGALLEARGSAAIGDAFASIAERLAAELWLTYEPARDGASELRARVVDDPSCRIRIPGGRPLSGAPRPAWLWAAEVEPVAAGTRPPTVLDEFCPVGRDSCFKPVEILRLPAAEPPPVAEPARMTLILPPDYIAGRALEAGDGSAASAMREFAVELPPLEEIQGQIRSAADVLDRWMFKGGGGSAFLLDGRTWLEQRPLLGQALYRSRTEYQRWADERVHRLRLDTPAAELAHAVLAEWLTDVPARDVALAFEARVAERARTLAVDERLAERERLEAFWPNLRAWFPVANRVAAVALLVPAYDPARDVVGFHRVLLPQAGGSADPDPLPPYPFGSRIHERLLRDREIGRLVADAEVLGIDYRPAKVGSAKSPDGFASALRLGGAGAEVVLTSFLAQEEGSFALRCMEVGATSRSAPLAQALDEHVESSGLSCPRGSARPAGGR